MVQGIYVTLYIRSKAKINIVNSTHLGKNYGRHKRNNLKVSK